MLLLVLIISIITMLAVGALAWMLYKRRLRRTELQILMDSIDLTREHIDTQATHTALEHKDLAKSLEKANGRLQFLIAKDISAELAAAKEADRAKEEKQG